MEGNSTTSVSVLITDPALDALSLYNARSSGNARRVEEVVASLKEASIHGRVLRLTGSDRPIWQLDVDSENCVYVTMGQGSQCVEARIAHFGSPLAETTESFRELLFLTGEAPHYALPDRVQIEDARAAARCPPHPERKLGPSTELDRYLAPTVDDLIE